MKCFIFECNICIILFLYADISQCENKLDILSPYLNNHGSRLRYREIRDCQKLQFGNAAHELFEIKNKGSNIDVVTFNKKMHSILPRMIKGHYSTISNPSKQLSLVEPFPEGCTNRNRATVAETSKTKNCRVAINAGYFNTTTGQCLGNVVNNGKIVQNSNGIQNAHFGILRNDSIFTGYLSEYNLFNEDFKLLVGGVIWLLRRGELYVNESMFMECEDIQETGHFDTFVNVKSARSAVGHDSEGRIIMLHVDGKTYEEGVNLWELGLIMKEFGAINAINLDGGGSSTFVINGTVVNYPSDICGGFNCARNVTTILCAHDSDCDASKCDENEDCINGECIAKGLWTSPNLDISICGAINCSGHGICSKYGCRCDPGWTGKYCDNECTKGKWGLYCRLDCECLFGICNTMNGHCDCFDGYTGSICDKPCQMGYYGKNCHNQCFCPPPLCSCDRFNGSCLNNSKNNNSLPEEYVFQCLNGISTKNNEVEQETSHYRSWLYITVAVTAIATFSIFLNIYFLHVHYIKPYLFCNPKQNAKNTKYFYRSDKLVSTDEDSM